jgi:prophage regulatory protein
MDTPARKQPAAPARIIDQLVRTGARLPLVGTAEIRVMLGGVSAQRTYAITSRADFPRPLGEIGAGRVWLRPAVAAWMDAHRRVAEPAEGEPDAS